MGSFPFQHDYAPVHKGRSIKAWLNEPGVEELDWLAQSPDLNPIKHLWDELELLQAKHFQALPLQQLSDLTNDLDKWAEIPTDTLQNLAENLPRRVEAIKAPKVGRTPH